MRSWLIALLTLISAVALADPADIRVEHVWSRAMPAGATGVVYLTITNHGASDALSGVATPVAASAGVHETIDDHGVMKMRPVASLVIPPGKPVTLSPGGYHIMLMGLKQALVAGTSFPLTLTFAKAGSVTVRAMVQAVGAGAPAMHQRDMGQMDMHGMPMRGAGPKWVAAPAARCRAIASVTVAGESAGTLRHRRVRSVASWHRHDQSPGDDAARNVAHACAP